MPSWPMDTIHMAGRRWAWHAIISLGQHRQSHYAGVPCHHRPWATHTVERTRALNAIISLGQHIRSNYVRRCMPSFPLDSTNGRTMLGVTCYHLPLLAHTDERPLAWHAAMAIGLHNKLDNIESGKPTWTLGRTQSRMTSGVKYHHRGWEALTVG